MASSLQFSDTPLRLERSVPKRGHGRAGRDDLDPVADSDPYPYYPTGEYIAVCVGSAYYRDPRFGVMKIRLDLQILDFPEFDQPVCKFFNIGKDGKVKHGSDYRRAWIMLNGSPPRRNDRLSRRTFHGRRFRVRIGDTTRRWNGKNSANPEHSEAEIYSTVKELLDAYPKTLVQQGLKEVNVKRFRCEPRSGLATQANPSGSGPKSSLPSGMALRSTKNSGKVFLAKGVTVLPLSEPSEEVKERFAAHRCEEEGTLDRQRRA